MNDGWRMGDGGWVDDGWKMNGGWMEDYWRMRMEDGCLVDFVWASGLGAFVRFLALFALSAVVSLDACHPPPQPR